MGKVETKRYPLPRTLKGDRYRTLIDFAVSERMTCGLVVRPTLGTSEGLMAVLAALEPDRVSTERVWAWPGTRTGRTTPGVDLHTFTCTQATGDVLTSAADGLYDWRQPARPEDLALHRPDGSLFLASCAHERFSWIDARPDETEDLRARDIRLFKPLGRTKSAQPAIPPEFD